MADTNRSFETLILVLFQKQSPASEPFSEKHASFLAVPANSIQDICCGTGNFLYPLCRTRTSWCLGEHTKANFSHIAALARDVQPSFAHERGLRGGSAARDGDVAAAPQGGTDHASDCGGHPAVGEARERELRVYRERWCESSHRGQKHSCRFSCGNRTITVRRSIVQGTHLCHGLFPVMILNRTFRVGCPKSSEGWNHFVFQTSPTSIEVDNAPPVDAKRRVDVDCVVLHDVDITPEDGRALYTCEFAPLHLAPYLSKFGYKYVCLCAHQSISLCPCASELLPSELT